MSKWDKYESQLVDRMQEEAHQAWLEEKEIVLDRASELFNDFKELYEEGIPLPHSLQKTPYYANSMHRIINFIEQARN